MARTAEQEHIHSQINSRKCTNDYRDWIAAATPEQKSLWARERKIHNRPECRAEYMKIIDSLQLFLPPSPTMHGGKYGVDSPRNIDRDAFMEGVKVHLKRF